MGEERKHDNTAANLHLMWRAGFGPLAADRASYRKLSGHRLFHRMLAAAAKKPDALDTASASVKDMMNMSGEPLMAPGQITQRRVPDPEQRRIMRRQAALDIRALSVEWMQEMAQSPAQLREKTALFWHGHFASKTGNIIYDQQLLQILRENALGSFRDLLFQVSRSASMIQFLNNNQNRKNHPNENFARELMELFTLGRGFYTETDVKESARAFTGWGADERGDFIYREKLHDAGPKTFLGKTGNFTGDDILNIILAQPQTARFICGKIYRFYVNEDIPEDRLNALSGDFFDSGYDLTALLTNIFTSDWFYAPENIGNHIKSPVEWLIGLRRQLPAELEDPQIQLLLGRLLGQVLFNPPNVAGWPGGRHWIDSSSLMLRLQFPRVMATENPIRAKPKTDDDVSMGMADRTEAAAGKTGPGKPPVYRSRIDWSAYSAGFADYDDKDLYAAISTWLLQTPPGLSAEALKPYLDNADRSGLIRSLTLRLMSTPEYQLS